MNPPERARKHSPSSLLLLAALICAGFAANVLAPRLFIGFNYLFGSIFVLMTLRLFGTAWGMVAGLVASSATIALFGHPYALPWLCAEPLFVGWLLAKGKTRNIIFFDAFYWPLLGAPLLWLTFRHVMHTSPQLSLAALLLYWITGIANALVASILLTHLPGLERNGTHHSPPPIPIHQLIFNILMAAVLVPAVVILVIYGRGLERQALRDMARDLESDGRNAVYEVRLARNHGGVAPDQGTMERERLARLLRSARRRESTRLILLDGEGTVMADTGGAPSPEGRFDSCPGGVPQREEESGLTRCTPRSAAPLPPWDQNRQASYSLIRDVADGTPWRVAAITPFAPYQLRLIEEYGRALLVVLGMNMVALAVSLYTSRRLAAPLLLLSSVTTGLLDRITEGRETLLPRSMVAEIDRLSDNFRAMAAALSARFQEISQYSGTLELRVRERTRELTRANDELKRENGERRETERQRDQLLDELVNQLRLLQKIIDAIPNPIFYHDTSGAYLGCNHAFELCRGLSREEIVGKTTRDLFPETMVKMLEWDGSGQPGVRVHEARLRYADGNNHEVIIYRATYDDTRGNPAGAVGNIVDISPRKKAEAERDRLVVELQQKNKELEGIVYVASHDLRSPLVNIQGFSRKLDKSCVELEKLLLEIPLEEERRRQLTRILGESIPRSLGFVTGSVEKMDTILKGLLRLSRLGRAALCFETLDMQALMERIVSSMTFQIDTAGARVRIDPLAPCLADAGQISQVFSNLLDNAVKYRSPRRPLVVRVFSEEFEEGVRYCVEDNGIGIPRTQQDAIWEIFQRLNPDESQGEGLGLTLARRIMSRMGGSIWVESEEGAGSRFYVVVPKPSNLV